MVTQKYIREVRTFDQLFANFPLSDSLTGLTYQADTNRLLSLPSISGAAASEITAITLAADQDTRYSTRIPLAALDPLNTTFDNKFDRLLSLRNANQLVEIKARADGSLDPTTLTRSNIARQFGLTNPQGLSVDPTNGTLFVLDRINRGLQIVRIQPDAKGSFANATVSRSNLSGTMGNLRGIALDPTSGHLHVLSPAQNQLYEVAQTGEIVATRILSNVRLKNPQALVFAPSGDQTDSPQAVSLYVADSGLGSDGITELTLTTPNVFRFAPSAPFVPTLVQTIQTSQFSPASPDPGGIVYISHTNTLLISDSEVEEIPALFTGKNLFNISLTGTLQSTLTTIGFSNEPAGVSYDPSNKNLFFADDDKKRILTLNPGADGQYNTSDDTVTSFSVTPFGAIDAEDVSFSPTTGTLFIVDGTNAEVYQVTTGGSLISQFDTQSFGIIDPEGIAVGDNGNLFIVGNPNTTSNAVGEFTFSGSLVRMIDISAANPIKPAGIAFAPSSSNSANRSLYIVDRGVDNNDDPNENDGRMYEFLLGGSTPCPGVLSFSAPTFSINENGTIVAAVQVARTSGSAGAVSATIVMTNGTAIAPADYNNSAIVVNFADGDTAAKTVNIPIVNDTLAEMNETVNLNLGSPTNGATIGSQGSAVLTIIDNDVIPSESPFYVSTSSNGTIGGVAFADEDILAYSPTTNTWSLYFDGSDVGLASFNLRDFHLNSDGSILFSLNNPTTLSGAGFVDDSDIVKFTPTSIGTNTAGTFSLYFDGSDVGLETDSEDLDAIAVAPDGKLLISTKGTPVVAGVTSAADEDLLAFSATSVGDNTAGTWTLYFDGSDVALTDNVEDVDGVWVDTAGKLYLTTEGAFNVPGVAGDGSDILTFTPTAIGDNTSGTYTPFFDGSTSGFAVLIDGVS